jgi:arylsulfatase A-like enzyme
MYHRLSDDPQGWSKEPWMPWDRFTSNHAYVDPASAAIYRNRSSQEPNKKKREMLGGPPVEAPDVADDVYPDGMIAVRAIEELRRLKDEPFFLGVGFVKPHLPFNAPKKYWDLYDAGEIRLPSVTALPAGAPAHALQYLVEWRELRRYAGIPAEGPLPEKTALQLIHGYYACVSYVDAQIGRVLAELERLGLRDNTIVVLWGDHGWKLGEYSAWCKHTTYEADTRTPLIISVPGQQTAGAMSLALVETVDVAPTLAELCGLDVPRHWEGASMVPLIADPDRPWKTAAFSRNTAKVDRIPAQGYSVRTRNWRYTEWISDSKVIGRELYDHRRDAMETRNVAEHPANAQVVAELSMLLARGEGWREVRQRLQRGNE